jgi:hypothetical protein
MDTILGHIGNLVGIVVDIDWVVVVGWEEEGVLGIGWAAVGTEQVVVAVVGCIEVVEEDMREQRVGVLRVVQCSLEEEDSEVGAHRRVPKAVVHS